MLPPNSLNTDKIEISEKQKSYYCILSFYKSNKTTSNSSNIATNLLTVKWRPIFVASTVAMLPPLLPFFNFLQYTFW